MTYRNVRRAHTKPGQDSRCRTTGTGQSERHPGQNSWYRNDRTVWSEHNSKDRRAGDKSARAGQLGKESQERKTRTGQKEGTVQIDQPDRKERT